MGRKVIPTTGRPRAHALKPGFRPQLAFNITSELMGKIRAAQAKTGRSQSAEVEHRLERSFQREDLLEDVITLRYGKLAGALIETIADVMQTATLWGNALVNREQKQAADWRQDDPRIYVTTLKAVHRLLDMLDPANDGPPSRPPSGPLTWEKPVTWETLADIAAAEAYYRASLDPRRRDAFKALGADLSKMKRRKEQ